MSIGKTLKGILGAIAPTIATAVGGPLGGVAMKFLADRFTGGDTGSVEDFLIGADPAALKDLKIADMEFDREMKALDIDLEEIHASDRSSARDLAKSKGMWPQVIISAVYSIGYFVIIFMFMAGHIKVPPEHAVMFGGLIGVLSAAQIQIMNFWFGSSSGSKEKTAVMASAQG